MRIYDDEFDRWIDGQILEEYSPTGVRLRLEYHGNFYLMENQFKSQIIEIREANNPDALLSRFYPRFRSPLISSTKMKYYLQIYSNDLPDPFYILAFSAFNARSSKQISG